MTRGLGIAALALATTGCVTFGQMEEGLGALMGQDHRVAFRVLGYPAGKQEFGSDTVYVWAVSRGGAMVIPQTTTTYGTVGTVPVYGSTYSSQVVPVSYNCEIKLVANSSGTLINWEYGGNIGGCSHYIRRLNEHMEATM